MKVHWGPLLKRRTVLLAALPATAHADALRFPRDFGTHNDTGIEWWYVTGELQAQAQLWGFQLTFFRSRTGLARGNASRFAARQLLAAHCALSDVRNGRLVHAQRIGRWSEADDDTLFAFASSNDTALRLQDWSLRRDPSGIYQAAFGDGDAGFACELRLEARQPVLLQGEAGISRKGPAPGDFSRYYSEPHLAVSGTLVRGTQRQAVRGRAWLDHEWSDALLPRDAVGWDWLGMNLNDGSALTAFRLRRADGSALWAGGSHRAAGAASARSFAPDEVRFTPLRRWTSPATHATYPVQWALDTPIGRHEVGALFDAQELDGRVSTGTVYWEGLSELRDAQGHVVGRGYLEMTGYAGRLRP